MAKNTCVICNNGVGMFSRKAQIQGGIVCSKCLESAVMSSLPNSKLHNADSAKELISHRIATVSCFNSTKNINKHLYIDENNRMFRVGKDGVICNFSDLISYELWEDGETITKGGIRGAVVGGLLAGGVGSVVGAVVGNKSKDICKSMQIVITVKTAYAHTLYINLIGGIFVNDIPKDNIIYQSAHAEAKSCMSALQAIANENEPSTEPAAPPVVDTALELQKFFDLKEKGVISEEEYSVKKAQLLGL